MLFYYNTTAMHFQLALGLAKCFVLLQRLFVEAHLQNKPVSEASETNA